jgi:hypothetical protein
MMIAFACCWGQQGVSRQVTIPRRQTLIRCVMRRALSSSWFWWLYKQDRQAATQATTATDFTGKTV